MVQEQSETVAPVVVDAQGHVIPPTLGGFGRFVHRVADGDFGPGTWLLLWESVGRPVLIALVLIVLVFAGAGWLFRVSTRALTRARVEPTLTRFLSNLVRYAVLIAGGIAILGTLGVETTSLAAALAAGGFAIGMALSGTLSNVAAGIMLLFFRPFKVDDTVVVNGVTARVYQINLFNTELDTPDNRRIIMPNNSVFNNTIENVSFHPRRRVEVAVGTAYDAGLDETRRVLEQAAARVQGGLGVPAPDVVLLQLGASSVNWSVHLWAASADFGAVKQRLIREVKVALDAAGIGIPFPQMDVHLDGVVRQGEHRSGL